jgi:replicative DNA helicase
MTKTDTDIDRYIAEVEQYIEKIKLGQFALDEKMREIEKDKKFCDEKIKFFEKITQEHQNYYKNHLWKNIAGLAFLFYSLELLSRINKDNRLIEIAEHKYKIEDASKIAKVVTDRYLMLKDAKEEGKELSDLAEKLQKEDSLRFLLEIETERLFKNSEDSKKFVELDKKIMKSKPARYHKDEDYQYEN